MTAADWVFVGLVVVGYLLFDWWLQRKGFCEPRDWER